MLVQLIQLISLYVVHFLFCSLCNIYIVWYFVQHPVIYKCYQPWCYFYKCAMNTAVERYCRNNVENVQHRLKCETSSAIEQLIKLFEMYISYLWKKKSLQTWRAGMCESKCRFGEEWHPLLWCCLLCCKGLLFLQHILAATCVCFDLCLLCYCSWREICELPWALLSSTVDCGLCCVVLVWRQVQAPKVLLYGAGDHWKTSLIPVCLALGCNSSARLGGIKKKIGGLVMKVDCNDW